MRVIVINTEKEDDWIRSPQVTEGHVPDKDLNWQTLENLNKSDFEESKHPRDGDGNFDIPPTSEA